MRLTRFGLKGAFFYVALVVAFLATPYSNLFFLLLSYLTLQWLSCAVWTPRNLRGVTVELDELEPVPVGAEPIASARLVSPGERFQVGVEIDLGGGQQGYGQVDRLVGEARVAVALPALARGVHPVRSARIVSTYPFGILRAFRRLPVDDELIVYPRPLELAPPRSGSDPLAQLLGRPSDVGERQPESLRDFREGDDVRSVHWRATARRGSLVVLEQEKSAGGGLELVLDRRCAPAELERALARIAALVRWAREAKEVLELHTQGSSARYGDGHRPWRDALRLLATAGVLPADGPEPPPVGPGVVRLPLGDPAPVAPGAEVQHAR